MGLFSQVGVRDLSLKSLKSSTFHASWTWSALGFVVSTLGFTAPALSSEVLVLGLGLCKTSKPSAQMLEPGLKSVEPSHANAQNELPEVSFAQICGQAPKRLNISLLRQVLPICAARLRKCSKPTS